MRLCTFSTDASRSWGVIDERGIVDLGARIGGSVIEVLQNDTLAEVRALAARTAPDHDPAAVKFEVPVERPEKIACIGVNYANRNAEYKDGSDEPEWPSLFMRTIDSFTGHDAPLWRPPESAQLDYEGEIALVIGDDGSPELTLGTHGRTGPLPSHGSQQEEIRPTEPARKLLEDGGHGQMVPFRWPPR